MFDLSRSENTFDINNFSFKYPTSTKPALSAIDLSVSYGEFITICGSSGSGKTTLLRNLKTVLAPHGEREGTINFYGRDIFSVDNEEQSKRIGFVLQDPENQIVTDKVWHELAFGLESLGYDPKVIRLRVAEMASFFGIEPWFKKDVSTLSGGQKQLLNLASVMAMDPDLLILDEPTSMLDPIASSEFIYNLGRINREIGTTILISEHNLEDVMPLSDRVVVMERGKIIANDAPSNIGNILASQSNTMFDSMPTPVRVHMAIDPNSETGDKGPITVRDGRTWLIDMFKNREIRVQWLLEDHKDRNDYAIKGKDVWFKYNKDDSDIIRGMDIEIQKEKFSCILGGNGTGKSTLLKILAGSNKPYRGKLKVSDSINAIGFLPQDPQTLFVENTVRREILEVVDDHEKADAIMELMDIKELQDSHPYDISGGEKQRVALAKILMRDPDMLILDEPTSGLDNHYKKKLGKILKTLVHNGKTILMVSHDLEFCAGETDMCMLMFDGGIVTENNPRDFFSGNSYYTTAANRMSRVLFPNAVTDQDVILMCKNNLRKK